MTGSLAYADLSRSKVSEGLNRSPYDGGMGVDDSVLLVLHKIRL
jgi:hypothetical protein